MNSRFLKGWIKFLKTTPNNFGKTKPITFDQEFNFSDRFYSWEQSQGLARKDNHRDILKIIEGKENADFTDRRHGYMVRALLGNLIWAKVKEL